MKCKEIMKKDVHSCNRSESVSACAKLMRDFNVGSVPVVDNDNKLIGILTDRDIALRVVAAERPLSTQVSQIMNDTLLTCRPDDDLGEAEERMAKEHKSRILVANPDGTCAGIISLSDISHVEPNKRAGEILSAVTEREARV